MERSVAQWVDDQRMAGLRVVHEPIRMSGFPFTLRADLPALAIEAPGLGRWRAESFRVEIAALRPRRLRFIPSGTQELWSAQSGRWRIEADQMRAALISDPKTGWRISAKARGAQSIGPQGPAIVMKQLSFAAAPNNDDPDLLQASLQVEGIRAKDVKTDYGPANAAIALSVSAADAFLAPSAFALWAANDGALTIDAAAIESDAAAARLDGVLRLDAAYRVQGQMNAALRNPAVFTDLLGAYGIIAPGDAAQAGAALTLTAIASGGVVSAPIRFESGVVSIAGLELAELAPLIAD